MEEPKLIKKSYKDIVKQKKVLIGISIFVLIVLIAPSYALLSNFKKLDDAVNVTTANMNMGITQSSTISLEGKLPEADASGLENANPVSITVKNANTGPFTNTENTKFQNTSASTIKIVKYELKLVPDTSDSNKTTTLDNQYIKYAVSTDNGTSYSTPKNLTDSNTIIYTGYNLDLGATKDIKLKIWIDENAGENGINKNYYGAITVEMYQNIDVKNLPKNSAMTYIANHDNIQFDSGIKFYEVNGTNNGNGLYVLPGTENDTNPIYFYRGNVENNNVYFAGYCWKIVRTTETGGTKMIYNGALKEIFETTTLSDSDFTVTNTSSEPFTYDSTNKNWTSNMHTHSGNAEITFVPKTAGNYIINYTVSSESGYDKVYFYKGSTELKVDSGSKSGNVVLDNLTTSDIIKVKYTKDSSGNSGNDNVIFSIGLKGEVTGTTCNNTGEDAQFAATSAFNSSYGSPAYVGYSLPASSQIYTYSTQNLNNNTGVLYGKSVKSDGTLEDPQDTLDEYHHYSYNSTDETATGIEGDTNNVRYYYYKSGTTGYFIKFDKTKSISTILNEMLSDNTNTKNNPSTIQGKINTWWSSLDSTYGSYLEDTSWCNDRSIGDLGGWDPNGGLLTKHLYFIGNVRYNQPSFGTNLNNIKNTNTPLLTCSNPNDNLTVSGGKISYKLGLLTYDEVAMAGAQYGTSNSNYYLYTGANYWLLSPSSFNDNRAAYGGYVVNTGRLYNGYVNNSYGVRPALSLAPGTTITGGDGSYTNPYRVG